MILSGPEIFLLSIRRPATVHGLAAKSAFQSIRHTLTNSYRSWNPTCSPKPSSRIQFLMLFTVFDLRSWDVSMVHVLLHFRPRHQCLGNCSGTDVCMFSRDLRVAHWRWIVWCMHVLCIDSDAQSCFESVVTSTLNRAILVGLGAI